MTDWLLEQKLDTEGWHSVRTRAASSLRALATTLKIIDLTSRSSFTMNLMQLQNPIVQAEFLNHVKEASPNGSPAIYTFILHDPSKYGAVREAFTKKPGSQEAGGVKYCALNATDDPKALYVGTGQKLRRRMAEHWGCVTGAGTHAMWLQKWAGGIDADVEVSLFVLPQTIKIQQREALEQQLWDDRKPLFGKRSGR